MIFAKIFQFLSGLPTKIFRFSVFNFMWKVMKLKLKTILLGSKDQELKDAIAAKEKMSQEWWKLFLHMSEEAEEHAKTRRELERCQIQCWKLILHVNRQNASRIGGSPEAPIR
jgi:hypothetical protein